jgi:hypothetical protein
MSKAVYDALFDGAAPPAPGLEQLALLAQTGQGLRALADAAFEEGRHVHEQDLEGLLSVGEHAVRLAAAAYEEGRPGLYRVGQWTVRVGHGLRGVKLIQLDEGPGPVEVGWSQPAQIRVTLVDEGAVEIVRFPQSEGLTLTAQDGTTHALRRVIP